MKIKDFLLLLLEEFNGRIESETRIQKLAFLVKKERNVDLGIEFKWHHYGPFSDELKRSLYELRRKGLIQIEKEKRTTFMGDHYRITKFQLTTEGQAIAEKIKNSIANDLLDGVYTIVGQYGHSPLNEILNYVYGAYSPNDL
jgi:uncharacterized protein YwgA